MPSMETVDRTTRMASTAAPSAPSLSPRPTHREAAIAAASVTRTSSSARLRSGAWVPGLTRARYPHVADPPRGGVQHAWLATAITGGCRAASLRCPDGTVPTRACTPGYGDLL